jgi:hypothetical protein
MVRLGAATVAVCGMRLSDRMFVGDSAYLLWMIEGNLTIRVHSGFCYIYNDDGAFLPYSGIPPEAILTRVSLFCTILEGVLKRLPATLKRNDADIIRAIAADRETFNSDKDYFVACRDEAMMGTRKVFPDLDNRDGDADDGEEAGDGAANAMSESWVSNVAKRIWRLCHSLRSEMMHERLVSLLVEWCETPRANSACVAYKDTCVEYLPDSSARILRHIQKSPANDCYLYIPHNLLDPVLEANCARLWQFYSRTFWANRDVFLCCQAALALAKRGINVDRCFIGESPGGVGQSLYSLHLSTMLGSNHGFFDPNVWYNEDELRKQVESFARCIVITGQEAPESAKKLHLDLFKKTMSGDGVAGRKPYGYTTRMFELIGWKRLEVNRMLRFAGVTSANFNSVFRRGLFWQAKARFHPPHVIEKLHPDHELDGHFEADPTLKQFLSSTASAAAGLRIQHAFEATTGRQECLDLIENYVAGGDESITEDKMREACGLPPRERRKDADSVAAFMVHVPDSQEDREVEEKKWQHLRDMIVKDMLERGVSALTLFQFQKLSLNSEEVPNHCRADLWKGLADRKFLVKGCANSSRGRASVQMQPVIMPAADFFQVVNCQKADDKEIFKETVNAKSVQAIVEKDCSLQNIDALLSFFQHKAKNNSRKRGRTSAQAEETRARFDKLAAKIADQQRTCKALAHMGLHDAIHAASPAKRLGSKTEPLSTHSVIYSYAGERFARDRRYAHGFAAQTCSRRLQQLLFPHTVDLDIQNCCLTILLQLYEKLSPQPPLPGPALDFLRQCVQDRAAVCTQKLQVPLSEGKQLINSVLHGASLPSKFKDCSYAKLLQQLSIYMRWLACSIFREEFESLSAKGEKRNPDATVFFYMWTAVEDAILSAWVSNIQSSHSPTHLSLHFDGIRLNSDLKSWANQQQQFLQECEHHIRTETGFTVSIVEKKHSVMLELLEAASTRTTHLSEVPRLLLQPGNSIPCACWHLLDDDQKQTLMDSLTACSRENSYSQDRGVRSYKQLPQKLMPVYGLPPPETTRFLLHVERQCRPRCVAVVCDQALMEVHVTDGAKQHDLSFEAFSGAYAAAVDRLMIASFALETDEAEASSDEKVLLDLEAGSHEAACNTFSDSATSASVSFVLYTGQELCSLRVSEFCTIFQMKQQIALHVQHLPFGIVLLEETTVLPLFGTWRDAGFPQVMQVVLKPRTNDFTEELGLAIQDQDHEKVIAVLEAGQEPDCWFKGRDTGRMEPALLVAAGARFFYSVHLLLNAFANPESTGVDGRTAMHIAVLANSPVTLQVLIQHNANVHLHDRRGETPLHYAAFLDNAPLVKQLVCAGGDALSPNINGDVPLYWCCEADTRAALMDGCWQKLSYLSVFMLNAHILSPHLPGRKLGHLCRSLYRFVRFNVPHDAPDLLAGSAACAGACAASLHQYLFRGPFRPADQPRVWFQLKLFRDEVEPLSPTLRRYPNLFWILPVPFDVACGLEEWKVMLFAASAFMTLLHKGHLVQLEGAMITWFWPEIVQDLSLLQIASAAKSSCGVKGRKRQLASALQFFSTLAAPYGQPAQGKATAMGTHVFYRYVLLQRYLQAHNDKRRKPSKPKSHVSRFFSCRQRSRLLPSLAIQLAMVMR